MKSSRHWDWAECLSQSFIRTAIKASNTSFCLWTNTAYSPRLKLEIANKILTMLCGRSKSQDESGFQFHLEAKCLQGQSHSSAFLLIKSGCGWIWDTANYYGIEIKLSKLNNVAYIHVGWDLTTWIQTYTHSLTHKSTAGSLYLSDRFKISPGPTVLHQSSFWFSIRVLAPVRRQDLSQLLLVIYRDWL